MKKCLAITLALCLVFTMVPLVAFAAENVNISGILAKSDWKGADAGDINNEGILVFSSGKDYEIEYGRKFDLGKEWSAGFTAYIHYTKGESSNHMNAEYFGITVGNIEARITDGIFDDATYGNHGTIDLLIGGVKKSSFDLPAGWCSDRNTDGSTNFYGDNRNLLVTYKNGTVTVDFDAHDGVEIIYQCSDIDFSNVAPKLTYHGGKASYRNIKGFNLSNSVAEEPGTGTSSNAGTSSKGGTGTGTGTGTSSGTGSGNGSAPKAGDDYTALNVCVAMAVTSLTLMTVALVWKKDFLWI